MKRFYKSVKASFAEGGWHIELDGKSVRTPIKNLLLIPTQELAEAVAREWDAQGETIDKNSMPLTGFAAIATDIVPIEREALITEMLSYAQTDLLCYRSEDDKLAPRQAAVLDPLIKMLEQQYELKLNVTRGVMPVEQPEGNEAIIKEYVSALGDFHFAGLMVAMQTMGSLFLAMLLKDGHIDAATALGACRFDETAQAERWGITEVFTAKQLQVQQAISDISRFFEVLGD